MLKSHETTLRNALEEKRVRKQRGKESEKTGKESEKTGMRKQRGKEWENREEKRVRKQRGKESEKTERIRRMMFYLFRLATPASIAWTCVSLESWCQWECSGRRKGCQCWPVSCSCWWPTTARSTTTSPSSPPSVDTVVTTTWASCPEKSGRQRKFLICGMFGSVVFAVVDGLIKNT